MKLLMTPWEKDVVVETFIHQFDKVVAVYRRLLIELYLYCAFCGFMA